MSRKFIKVRDYTSEDVMSQESSLSSSSLFHQGGRPFVGLKTNSKSKSEALFFSNPIKKVDSKSSFMIDFMSDVNVESRIVGDLFSNTSSVPQVVDYICDSIAKVDINREFSQEYEDMICAQFEKLSSPISIKVDEIQNYPYIESVAQDFFENYNVIEVEDSESEIINLQDIEEVKKDVTRLICPVVSEIEDEKKVNNDILDCKIDINDNISDLTDEFTFPLTKAYSEGPGYTDILKTIYASQYYMESKITPVPNTYIKVDRKWKTEKFISGLFNYSYKGSPSTKYLIERFDHILIYDHFTFVSYSPFSLTAIYSERDVVDVFYLNTKIDVALFFKHPRERMYLIPRIDERLIELSRGVYKYSIGYEKSKYRKMLAVFSCRKALYFRLVYSYLKDTSKIRKKAKGRAIFSVGNSLIPGFNEYDLKGASGVINGVINDLNNEDDWYDMVEELFVKVTVSGRSSIRLALNLVVMEFYK
jgi:hypothetical protein